MKQRYAFRILSMLLAFVLVFELFPTGHWPKMPEQAKQMRRQPGRWPKAKPAVQSLAK